jgi:hypothetical protein
MKLPFSFSLALGLSSAPVQVDTQRYQAFVREVALSQQVWGLLDAEGWISLRLDGDTACLPVWAQPQAAWSFAQGPRTGCTVGAIELPDFLDHWLPAMDRLGVQVAVHPADQAQVAPVTARVLAWHLQARCVSFPMSWIYGPGDHETDAHSGKP